VNLELNYYDNRDKLVCEIKRIEMKLYFSTNKTSAEYHQLKRKVKKLHKILNELRNQ